VSGDIDLKKALDRLVKQREEQAKDIARLTGKLENEDFVAKAPAEVLTEHRARLRSLQQDQAMQSSSEQQLRTLLEA
jgi:valyl-tRNA synthetase